MREDARDRVQDEGGAGSFQVGSGAGTGQHARDDRGPGTPPGLDVVSGVTRDRELADGGSGCATAE